MKKIRHEHYGAYCPKCHGELMLEVASWSEMNGDLYYVFCPACIIKGSGSNTRGGALLRFDKALEQRARIDSRKPEKILTDIRDYLVEWQRCLAIESRMCPRIRETALVLSMIEDLQKYAEKLGVEL